MGAGSGSVVCDDFKQHIQVCPVHTLSLQDCPDVMARRHIQYDLSRPTIFKPWHAGRLIAALYTATAHLATTMASELQAADTQLLQGGY